jgi:hypothetical protein
MKYNIEQVLGNDYCMFYHPGLQIDQFTPVMTFKTCADAVNCLMELHGRNFSCYSAHRDIVGQLVRANWIYQRLLVEPIRKPILVHRQNNKFVVDCGDTRLMAVSALKNPPALSAIITVKTDQADQYQDWISIKNNLDLVNLLNFDCNTLKLMFTPADSGLDWCINWFEIGDRSTSHHLHDVNARVAMMQNWIKDQPADFEFSVDWLTESIDWSKYQDCTS